MIKKLFYIFFLLSLLVCLGAGAFLYWAIVVEPGEEISESNIRSILGKESPVYYSDGVTPLGVFFADAHRQYVEFDDIPETFVNALVAAEDNRFFSHFGFDVVGITRAAIKNIQARRVVQGGSTLTQQTAKNLFKRKDRSLQAKLKELLFALRLEYHYSKEQILEFYTNQFYVSGNGLGLGVAARYYFDKPTDELSLVEAAFIAGSVKRPNYYNPFIKRNDEGASKAKERGKVRASYVLKNMRELGMISDSEYQEAIKTDIPFKKGDVGYSLDYVMELVTDAVASDRVVDAMAEHDIDNIATSGIRIITTVDKDVQADTLYSLRKQLSYLDVRLRGYEREEVQAELEKLAYQGDTKPDDNAFLFGVIRSIHQQGEELKIDVYLGRHNGSGVIDRQGISSLVDARVKWQEHRWSESSVSDYQDFLSQLKEGDRVWVSIRQKDSEGKFTLDLHKYPLVKGGAIILKKGQIMAVAGGVQNRFFNRAVYGKRTMGSSYKPFVFAAALQLGWNSADLLPNKRDVFVYQNQPYFPRPDHEIDYELVSMSWAGVRSENLASVWLAQHLCDHLSRSELTEVAAHAGLAPRFVDGEKEPYRLFRSRIRDRYGIVINQDVLRQAAYRKTISSIGPDLVFEGLDDEYDAIKNLHYGLGFAAFSDDIDSQLNRSENDEGTVLSDSQREELIFRKGLLARNFLSFSKLRRELRRFMEQKQNFDAIEPYHFNLPGMNSDEPGLYYDRVKEQYLFGYTADLPVQVSVVHQSNFQQYLGGLETAERKRFIDDIMIGGTISVAAFDFVYGHMDSEFQKMRKLLPYSMEILEHIDDYRTLVGLNYLIAFGRAMGIESELEPVLSFPLGANVVTLLETTRVYETLVTGQITLFKEKNNEINNTLAIIDRIESEDGKVLYQPEPENSLLVDPTTAVALGHILENTVKFGTGRYADKNVRLSSQSLDGDLEELSLPVPLLGKTGTANRYTNASFFGYLPAMNDEGNGMEIDGGYAVGVYVGYDDNKVMRQKTTRITGASGALPAWTDIINALLKKDSYSSEVDPVDLSFYGLVLRRNPLGQLNLSVSAESGGTIRVPLKLIDELDRYQPSIMTFGNIENDNRFTEERSYIPFWQQKEDQGTPMDPTVISEKDL